jgi:soluble lytic murein transglycosylase
VFVNPMVRAAALIALLNSLSPADTTEAELRRWHLTLAARELQEPAPPPEDLVHWAALAVAAGDPDRARRLLERYPVPPDSPLSPHALRVLAAAAYAQGDFPAAGRLFAAAAADAGGVRRGVLEARAGDAFDRAGETRAAEEYYRAALRRLPDVAGWIAIRLARLVPDTSLSLALLERAPRAGRTLALGVRAELLARVGAVGRAASELAAGGFPGRAAGFALRDGDTSRARRLVYSALAGSDTTEAQFALDVLGGRLPARDREERIAGARALAQRARYPEAARWYREAVAAGDSSPATLHGWGQVLEAARDRKAALRIYGLAARRRAGAGVDSAEFCRARLLLRSGRKTAGVAALLAFARTHPDHPAAPAALLAVADEWSWSGRWQAADSLYQAVLTRWPNSSSASEARFTLAGRALQRRDIARARVLYQAVVGEHGPDSLAARFALARLARQGGDTLGARAQWAALVQDDPIGYYGTLARKAARLPPLSFGLPQTPPGSREISQAVAILGLLDAIGFDAEAEAFVAALVAHQGYAADQLLELAEGLVARGRTSAAASLGWRAARQLTLGNPRVLHVIFPWPWRPLIQAEAREFGIDPYLLAAVIRQESGFRAAVVSHAGAWGLMQLMPRTAAKTASRLGVPWRERFLTVPDANVHVGAAHLAMLVRRYRGELVTALAAYNAGARPAERWARLPGGRDPFWFVEQIPYPETRGYVRSVMRNRALYEALYPPVAVR